MNFQFVRIKQRMYSIFCGNSKLGGGVCTSIVLGSSTPTSETISWFIWKRPLFILCECIFHRRFSFLEYYQYSVDFTSSSILLSCNIILFNYAIFLRYLCLFSIYSNRREKNSSMYPLSYTFGLSWSFLDDETSSAS